MTLWTSDQRVWVRNIARDPRIAFSVQTFEPPYPAVMMRGRATAYTADDGPAVLEEARAISRRYLPDEWPDLRTIVRVVPDHTVSWSAGT